MKIGIIGPESTGKTTLCKELASMFGGACVGEYARGYVEGLGRAYTYEDVEMIARQQMDELRMTGLCFYDTELIITKVWFEHKWGVCPMFVEDFLRDNPIDFYLLCSPDLPFVPDPVRENPHLRAYLFGWYEREIQAAGKPYAVVGGTGAARVEGAAEAVRRFLASR